MSSSTALPRRTQRDLRPRRTARRFSAPTSKRPTSLQLCGSLPRSLEALDLSTASPTQTLASLRFLVLTCLADLERRLSQLESPDFGAWKLQGELTIEEAKQWASTALEMLKGIRADVCSHLPEFHFADLSLETFVKSHLPDIPDVPNFTEMRSRLPDMEGVRSHFPDMEDVRFVLPDMADVRSHLPEMPQLSDMDDVLTDMRLKLDDVRTRFQDLHFQQPLRYIPTLSNHLKNLHSHLSSMELPSGGVSIGSSAMLSDLLDALLSSEVVADILNSTPEVMEEGEEMLEKAAHEVASAVRRSLDGVRLIKYHDLPHQWKNNPFVTHGYRFIPIKRWPLLVMSIFTFHNETLNIHTHLIPFVLWGISLFPLINSTTHEFEAPEVCFMAFALLCLFSSAVWHTMSGCADPASMEFCARIDYIGIGWLISASIGTAVHYAFQKCYPQVGHAFLCLCFLTGLAGNIFPFMAWFNQHKYRMYRIAFFVSMAFSGIGPMVAFAILHSRKEMFDFIAPVFPSLLSYIIGLFFYAAHFPERILPDSIRDRLDFFGGGSHAIWHCFIVLAVSQHRFAIQSMKGGVQCPS